MSETINTGEYQNTSSGGGCGKVLLWLFFIALILSCLCCAGLFGTSVYIANAIKNGYVEDPVIAQEKAEEAFGELNLPETIKPQAFIDVKMFGKDFGFACIYSWNSTVEEGATVEASDDNNGSIVFYSLSDFLKGNEKEFVDNFSQNLSKQNNEDLSVKRSETVQITINGKPCDFSFNWMENNSSKATFLVASGNFTSKKETLCNVMIVLPGEPSQEAVTTVLENIQ